MALNTFEMWSNVIKTAFFSQKYEELPSDWGLRSPDPRLWYAWVTVAYPTRLLVLGIFTIWLLG